MWATALAPSSALLAPALIAKLPAEDAALGPMLAEALLLQVWASQACPALLAGSSWEEGVGTMRSCRVMSVVLLACSSTLAVYVYMWKNICVKTYLVCF